MNDIYRRQVALLIRVMPLVFKIKDFAVHGGTAINLFHRNLPRYSVDIDVTYIPLEDHDTSLANINSYLSALKTTVEKAVPGIRVIHKPMYGNCSVPMCRFFRKYTGMSPIAYRKSKIHV